VYSSSAFAMKTAKKRAPESFDVNNYVIIMAQYDVVFTEVSCCCNCLLILSDDCRYGVFVQFMKGNLDCSCPQRCSYVLAHYDWPNGVS